MTPPINITTTMTEGLALTRLMAWLSPVFPTGGFAYSSGLEAAATKGIVHDQASLEEWLLALMQFGRLHNDAVYLACAHRHWDDLPALESINDLALAAAGSEELHLETTAQGKAFVAALAGWPEAERLTFPQMTALPVAVGTACGMAAISPHSAIIAFIHAFVANQLQISIRLSVMGQTGAAQSLAKLEQPIVDFADAVQNATLDDLGSAAFIADIVSMQHESQRGRMFRS